MSMDFDVWFPEEQAMTLDQYRRATRQQRSRRVVTPRSGRRSGQRQA